MDTCPSCGATLKDVPYENNRCPHCGYDLDKQPLGSNTQNEPIGKTRVPEPEQG